MMKAVVFDIDNVLYDRDASLTAAADAVSLYCEKEFDLHFSLLEAEPPEVPAVLSLCLSGSENVQSAIPLYAMLRRACIVPYPEVAGILSELKRCGMKLAVFTRAEGSAVIPLLDALGYLPFFDAVYTHECFAYRKRVTNPYAEVLQSLGLYADEGVMVGEGTMQILREFSPSRALSLLQDIARSSSRTNQYLRRAWKYSNGW